MHRSIAILLAVAALVALRLEPAAAERLITVIVDGRRVQFDVPPVQVGARVLVPLRGVFEPLGAFVRWSPRDGAAHVRGVGARITLRPGDRLAEVDDRKVALDVPPLPLGARVLVPLRFVGEALGAGVEWDPATRTVRVTGTSLRRAGDAPLSLPIRFDEQAGAVEGALVRVDERQIVARQGAATWQIEVTPATVVIRTDARTGQSAAADLGRLRPGDDVRVTLSGQNTAALILATTLEITGGVRSVSGSSVLLDRGGPYAVRDDARITEEGRGADREAIRPGARVRLRLNPVSRQVWEVEVLDRPPSPPPPPRPVRSVVVDAPAALRAGRSAAVVVRGTPGGRATFTISGLAEDLPMTERRPGEYAGVYTAKPGDDVTAAAVFARLRTGGAEAVVQAGRTVTVDTTPPAFSERGTPDGVCLANTTPNVVRGYDDRGSGVEPRSVRVLVNGRDVTGQAVVTPTGVSYTPPELPPGEVVAAVRAADRAGNRSEAIWRFTVASRDGDPIRAIAVEPIRPLAARERLAVVVLGRPRSDASFAIPGVVRSVPLAEESPGRYVGAYTVRDGDDAPAARVVARLVARGGPDARAEATASITILGHRPRAVIIDWPLPGSRVGPPLPVEGTAQPLARVSVEVRFEAAPAVRPGSGVLGAATAVADFGGRWRAVIAYSGLPRGATVFVTATAAGPARGTPWVSLIEVAQR